MASRRQHPQLFQNVQFHNSTRKAPSQHVVLSTPHNRSVRRPHTTRDQVKSLLIQPKSGAPVSTTVRETLSRVSTPWGKEGLTVFCLQSWKGRLAHHEREKKNSC